MKHAEAIRLKPGTKVLCRDHHQSQKARQWWTGHVVRVTDSGGILVHIIEGKSLTWDWCGPGTGPDAGTEIWFPYSRVGKTL